MLKKWINSWIDFSAKRSWLLVLTGLALFVLTTFIWIQSIKVDAQLEALLPKNSPALASLKETQKRFGSTDMFTIAINASTPVEVAQIQDEVVAELKKWEDAVSIQHERSQEFFSDHALFYLPDSELVKIRNALADQKEALQNYNPLLDDLMGDGPPKADYKPDPTLPQKLGLPDEAANSFKKFLGADSGKQAKALDPKAEEYDPKASVPDSLSARIMGRSRDGIWVGAVQAVLNKPSSDINYVKTVLARSKLLIEALLKKHPHTRIEISGPYSDLEEVNSLESNGLWATIVAVLLTWLIIAAFFRSLGSVKLIIYQALLSCSVVLLIASQTFGRLNLYTVFVIAILFGAGTNYPIFLLGYAQNLVAKGRDWASALKETYASLMTSLLVACTTIAAGMLVLLVAQFTGFFEFGVLGASGIVLSMVLTMIFLPAHIFVIDRIAGWKFRHIQIFKLFSLRPIPMVGWVNYFFRFIDLLVAGISLWIVYGLAMAVAPSIEWNVKNVIGVIVALLCLILAGVVLFYLIRARSTTDYGTPWEKRAKQGAILTGILTMILCFYIPYENIFEYDFAKLRELPKKNVVEKPGMSVGSATGSSRSSSQPVIALVDNKESIRVLHDTLVSRIAKGEDPYLKSFLTIHSFAPDSSSQVRRAPLISEIHQILSDSVFDLASGKDSTQVAQLRQMSAAKPFNIDDLPSWTVDLVRERTGEVGRIGFIYGRFKSSDAREAAEFEKRYGPCLKDDQGKHLQGICLEGVPQASLYSSSFIYAEVVHYVKQDSVKIFALMALNLVLLLALLLRDWRRMAICLVGMIVGAIWTAGLMGALGQKMNVFNLIALSDLQAVAVESVCYLILEYVLLGRKNMKQVLGNIGMLVAICELTTLAGYAGMLFTNHQGIMSIGSFAVIGLASFLVTSLCLTPWLSTLLLEKQVKTDSSHVS